jgi:hypothetical protein
VAAKRNTRRRTASSRRKAGRNIPAKYIFWLIFFLLVTGLFLINWKLIRATVTETGLLDRLFRREREDRSFLTEPAIPPPEPAAESPPAGRDAPAAPSSRPSAPAVAEPASRAPEAPPEPAAPSRLPDRQPTAAPIAPPPNQQPAGRTPPTPPLAARPAASPQQPAATPAAPAQQPARPEPAARADRAVYLMRVDQDGSISRSRVIRSLPVSDSPLLDALNALLQGPTGAELRSNLHTMIPAGTRVLSARVQGSTAYIDFSEEFQFNPYGVEGWASQLRQVVWTATEFSTVTKVQILIEGRQLNYLGEGIWIGTPVGRDDL